jgi:hypothetical protein
MPERNRMAAAAALALALGGCAIPQAYSDWRGAQGEAFTVAEVRADPAGFLAAHQGQRVLVEGYYLVDRLTAGASFAGGGAQRCEDPAATEQRIMLPDVALNRTVFAEAVRHRVVVEGTASPPRDLSLGGGDLTVPYAAADMVLVLDQARVVAVDWSGMACLQDNMSVG